MTELRDSACHLSPREAHRRCNHNIADGGDLHEGTDVTVAIATRVVPRLLQLGVAGSDGVDVMVAIASRVVPRLLPLGVAGSDGDVGDRCTSAKLQAAMLAQWPLRLPQLRTLGNDSDGGDYHGGATATAATVFGT